ncbi:MAG: formyltransferase family protein [Desulfovibrio sp.]
MKLALLTTETIHHCLFVDQVLSQFNFKIIIIERKIIKPPFSTHYDLEAKSISYEKSLIKSKKYSLKEYAKTIIVDTINDQQVVTTLLANKIDVVVVFGTSFIKSDLINKFAGRAVNLHGGDPEKYRGLDSHFWAIYHSDFNSLATTLHLLDSGLDTGHIVLKWNISLQEVTDLHQLRATNTLLCARLFITSMLHYAVFGKFDSYKQRELGRYYSFMPSELKALCAYKFYTHIQRIKA